MDNHIKMMDTLHYLDSYGLQFICESAEALLRERMPTQAPPGYHMLQVLDNPCVSTNNPPLSQELYRAASNLGTAIVEPQQVPPQQHLVGNHCPDPEIESTVAKMYRHKQASGMPSMDSNNNLWWGCGISCPLSSCYTWISHCLSSPSGIKKTEDQKPKAQDHCSLAMSFLPYALVTLLLGFLYLFTACVLFRKNHVNVFALCSRPYHYSWFISGLATLASCILSFQTAVHYNVCLKHLILSKHCIIILLYFCTVFSSLAFRSLYSVSGVTISRVICWWRVIRTPAICS